MSPPRALKDARASRAVIVLTVADDWLGGCSERQTYLLLICLNLTQLPIGCASMGRTPGLCSPEIAPKKKISPTAGPVLGPAGRVWAVVADFFSAFVSSKAFVLLVCRQPTVTEPPHRTHMHPQPAQFP